MADPLPAADLVEKFKGIELDKFDSHLLLGLIVFFAALLAQILLLRANIKDYENVVSWLIAGIVALALLYVAGARVKRPPRARSKPKPEEAKPA